MIQVRRFRDLDLVRGAQEGRGDFVSSASGLVIHDERFYVVADDEFHLGVFPLDGATPGRLHRLLPGTLPLESHARKKAKPDFEALLLLREPVPALFAIPSGSTSARNRGAWIPLPVNPGGMPREIDFSPLFQTLSRKIPQLNIEGAVVSGAQLRLFQRGNGAGNVNAIIDLEWGRVQQELTEGRLTDRSLQRITPCDLGDLRGVPLSFTDATTASDGSVIFLAVAEATEDTYHDGKCEGSVIGRLDFSGRIIHLEEVLPQIKAEGIELRNREGKREIWLVTDGDDPTKPAGLYFALLSI